MPQATEQLRQAAILVASLDEPLAEQVLDRLSPEDSARVRAAAETVGRIAPTEREMAMQAFVEAAPIPSTKSMHSAGVELDDSLAARLASLVDENEEATPTSGPFGFLEAADVESIATALRNENPQTIAVVLSCLTSELSADLLVRLPSKLQVNILRRMSDLEPGDPESVQAIASELQMWVEDQQTRRQRREKGVSTIQGILAAVGQNDRDDLVEQIRYRDEILASRLDVVETKSQNRRIKHSNTIDKSEMSASGIPNQPAHTDRSPTIRTDSPIPAAPSLRFDDVANLDDRDWTTLLRSAEPELTVLAFTGASDRMVDRIASRLTPNDAATLRRSLAFPGPTKLSDVEAAREELARLASQIVNAQPLVA